MTLPGTFIQSLVSRLNAPGIVGMAVTGSYARGQGGRFSDVDVTIYVDTMPENRYDRFTLRSWDGRLVSLKYIPVEEELAELSRPWDAIWAVPGLRQMRIVLDNFRKLAELQRLAKEFEWSKLQPAADEYAVVKLMGCAEEVHKILNGLTHNMESAVLYAVWGLVKGLAEGIATQRGLLIESENRYFDIIQDSVGRTSEWTHSFRLALGADHGPLDMPPFKMRGAAALRLYRHTETLLSIIIPDQHREVIQSTVDLIQQGGY